MQITIYSKKRNTKEGKVFYTYMTKLRKTNGTEITSSVKFRDECGAPRADQCPMNIIVDKNDCNFNSKTIINANDEQRIVNTLWVSKWIQGEPFIDRSMDEFI